MHTFQAGIRVISIAIIFVLGLSLDLANSSNRTDTTDPNVHRTEPAVHELHLRPDRGNASGLLRRSDSHRPGRTERDAPLCPPSGAEPAVAGHASGIARTTLATTKSTGPTRRLPVASLRLGASAGIAIALAYFLGDRLLTPGRFVALFRGVDDMLGAGSSLGYHSMTLQNQNAEISYVREFLDLPEDDGAWMQQPPADREPTRPSSPNRYARGLPSKMSGSPIRQRLPPRARTPVPSCEECKPAPQVRRTSGPRRRRTAQENRPSPSSCWGLYQPTAGEIAVDGSPLR